MLLKLLTDTYDIPPAFNNLFEKLLWSIDCILKLRQMGYYL